MLKTVGIIGPDNVNCTTDIYDFGLKLGESIASKDRLIISGGLGGFMEAVCCGVKRSADTFYGQTIGILSGDNKSGANKFVDIPIATGIGIARNIIIVNSVDILIAVGGGSGTLSEMAFAWQKGKKVLCVNKFQGWAKELGGRQIDNRHENLFVEVDNIDQILKYLTN